MFWWLFKNWKQIKEANFDINFCKRNKKKYMSNKISPIPRTLFYIIPIVNLFILYDLFKAIISYAKINKIYITRGNESPGTLLFLYLLLRFLGGNIIPFGIIPLLMIQSTFNKTWEKIDKRPIRKSPYISEWIALILGPILVFLYLIFIFIEPSAFLPTTYLEEVPQHIENSCSTYCIAFDDATHYSLEYDYIEEVFDCYCLNNNGNEIASNSYWYTIE